MSLSISTTFRLRRTSKDQLKHYKEAFHFKSMEKALLDALHLAKQYRVLSEIYRDYELTKGELNE